MLYSNYMRQDIKGIYGGKAITESQSHLISHWGSKEHQESNFKQVANVLSKYPEVTSILDVGSGIGTIREFIPNTIEYTGIDITPEVVTKANDPLITEADVVTYEPNKKFDAVVALGSFNMGVSWDNVKLALDAMYKLANIVTVVSISYTSPSDIEELKQMGWTVITNPVSFADGYGDKHILIRISHDQDSREIAKLEELLNEEDEWRNQ